MVAEAQRRALVLKLYREMLWTAKFAYPAIVDGSIYAREKVRVAFREHFFEADHARRAALYEEGLQKLKMLRAAAPRMHEYTSRARVPRTRAPLHPLDLPRLSRDTTVRAQRLYELEERFLAVPAGRLDQEPDSDPTRATSSGASAKPFSLLHAIAAAPAGTVPPIAPSMSPPVSSLSARRPVPASVVDHAAAATTTPTSSSPSTPDEAPSETAAPAAPAAQHADYVDAKAADDTIEAPSEVTPTPVEEVSTPAADAPSPIEEQPPQEAQHKDEPRTETDVQAHVDEPAVASDAAAKPERPPVQDDVLAVDAFAPSSRKPPAAKSSSSKRRAAKKQTGQAS